MPCSEPDIEPKLIFIESAPSIILSSIASIYADVFVVATSCPKTLITKI